ncbi:MAG: hypothetical protein ABSG90_13490 [Dehalococcoidia bacterium]|jgi:hypothetical protein
MKIVVEVTINEWLPAKELMKLEKEIKAAVEPFDSSRNANILSKIVTIVE